MGGLGNQLFQIFTIIAYAIKSQNIFKFCNTKKLGGGKTIIRTTYWNTFLYTLQPFLIENSKLPVLDIIHEQQFHYKEISTSSLINKNTCLHGYFQSYKYFHPYFATICKIIQLEKQQQKVIDKSGYTMDFLHNSISLHFRLGDYKKVEHVHPILKYDYYVNALLYLQEELNNNNNKNNNNKNNKIQQNILYFCEDEDLEEVEKTIYHLKQLFTDYTFIRSNVELEDWEQMLCMSCCKHNIIANSTFSWWGAYFNNHPNKIVCCPSVWFGPNVKHDTKDLLPPEWIKIKIDE